MVHGNESTAFTASFLCVVIQSQEMLCEDVYWIHGSTLRGLHSRYFTWSYFRHPDVHPDVVDDSKQNHVTKRDAEPNSEWNGLAERYFECYTYLDEYRQPEYVKHFYLHTYSNTVVDAKRVRYFVCKGHCVAIADAFDVYDDQCYEL